MEIDNEIDKLERSLKTFAVCEPAVETLVTSDNFKNSLFGPGEKGVE